MQLEVVHGPEEVGPTRRLRRLITDQLSAVLEQRSTRFAVIGFLLVAASISTLIPTPDGVDLAWMFIVPVAVSAIAGGIKEGALVALGAAIIAAFYVTASTGRIDGMLVIGVFVERLLLYGITALVLGAFAEAHQSVQTRLRDLASLDPLTKVSNVARFYDEMGIMEARSETFSLLLVDVDDLKVMNDRYGHQVGSGAIRLVADALRRVVRTSDCVARFGGDEFVLILKDADRAGAGIVAERLRGLLADETLEDTDAQVTVSVGIALFGEDGTTSEELLAKADEAMYADKRSRKAAS